MPDLAVKNLGSDIIRGAADCPAVEMRSEENNGLKVLFALAFVFYLRCKPEIPNLKLHVLGEEEISQLETVLKKILSPGTRSRKTLDG